MEQHLQRLGGRGEHETPGRSSCAETYPVPSFRVMGSPAGTRLHTHRPPGVGFHHSRKHPAWPGMCPSLKFLFLLYSCLAALPYASAGVSSPGHLTPHLAQCPGTLESSQAFSVYLVPGPRLPPTCAGSTCARREAGSLSIAPLRLGSWGRSPWVSLASWRLTRQSARFQPRDGISHSSGT